MSIYADQLTARVKIMEQCPIRSTIATNGPELEAQSNQPVAPVQRSPPSAPTAPQENYSVEGEYAMACARSLPPSKDEEFYEAPEQNNLSQKGEEELPMGAEARKLRPNPMPNLPPPAPLAPPMNLMPNLPPLALLAPQQQQNVSRFDFNTLPKVHFQIMLHFMLRTLCIGENSDYPYLRVILSTEMTFLGHPFDPTDCSMICHQEDMCQVRRLKLRNVDQNGYAYYVAETLYKISHISQDDSGSESIAWAQLTKIRPDRSEDFYFIVLPSKQASVGTTICSQ